LMVEVGCSTVTFAHDKIERAENGDGVADHVAGMRVGEDAEVDKEGERIFRR